MSRKSPKPKYQDEVPQPTAAQVEQLMREERESLAGEVQESHLIPVSLEIIPVQVPLPCAVYLKVAGRFVLFRNPGERITHERVHLLQEKGGNAAYLHQSAWKLFLATLETMALPETATPMVKAEHLKNLLVAYGQELEKKVKEPKKPAFDVLRTLAGQMAETLSKDPVVGARLIRRHRDPTLYFVEHAINTSIYSTLIGMKMGVAGEPLKQLAAGGLLHDIGYLLLSRAIAYATHTRTPEEQGEFERHSRLGAEILQGAGAPPPVVLCALQHHEREDGDGYPAGLRGSGQSLFAKIVGIADCYDDLVGPQPGGTAHSSSEAIEIMRTTRGRFDPKFLEVVRSATES